MSSASDLTAMARIRDAAIVVFAREGFSRATLRDIAKAAGVSPALIVHHYGSKAGLQAACDRYLLDYAAAEKQTLLSGDMSVDPAAYLAEHPQVAELLAYLRRALQEGGALADRWFDDLVEHTNEALAGAESHGLLVPSDDPDARAAVVVAQSLATLVFAPQLARHLGGDTLTDPAAYARLGRAVSDLHTGGLVRPESKGTPHE